MTQQFELPTFSRNDIEALWQLFKHGPTWDGNLISKQNRTRLKDLGFVERGEGWNWLTTSGTLLCLELGMGADDRKKSFRRLAP